jgi:hypothetical protein
MDCRILGAVAAVLLPYSVAMAQEPPKPASSSAARPEVGAVGGVGLPGRVAAVRLGGQVNERFAVDFSAGHVDGADRDGDGAHGFSFGAQVRWLWHGRDAKGRSGYWLAGPQVLQSINRTEVRWPDRPSTYIVDETPLTTVQFGYGWDVLMKNGARAGLEISTGGSERGASPFVHLFVVWGPRPARAARGQV